MDTTTDKLSDEALVKSFNQQQFAFVMKLNDVANETKNTANKLEKAYIELGQRYDILEAKNDDFKGRNWTLKEENDLLKQKVGEVNKLEIDNDELKGSNWYLKEETRELREQLANLRDEKQLLEANNKGLHTANTNLLKKTMDLADTITDMNKKEETLEKDNKRLEEVIALYKEKSKIQEEIIAHRTRICDLDREKNTIFQEKCEMLEKVTREVEKLSEVNAQLFEDRRKHYGIVKNAFDRIQQLTVYVTDSEEQIAKLIHQIRDMTIKLTKWKSNFAKEIFRMRDEDLTEEERKDLLLLRVWECSTTECPLLCELLEPLLANCKYLSKTEKSWTFVPLEQEQ